MKVGALDFRLLCTSFSNEGQSIAFARNSSLTIGKSNVARCRDWRWSMYPACLEADECWPGLLECHGISASHCILCSCPWLLLHAGQNNGSFFLYITNVQSVSTKLSCVCKWIKQIQWKTVCTCLSASHNTCSTAYGTSAATAAHTAPPIASCGIPTLSTSWGLPLPPPPAKLLIYS